VLLRSGPWTWRNLLNVRGGMISMVPNVFPIVLIFGMMGHLHVLVDIGTMMTASVAGAGGADDGIALHALRIGAAEGPAVRLDLAAVGALVDVNVDAWVRLPPGEVFDVSCCGRVHSRAARPLGGVVGAGAQARRDRRPGRGAAGGDAKSCIKSRHHND
ncbi:MAG: hypothetical protein R6X35_07845, partial [Candidatus Krumholzibacteriia bacterium]